MRQVLRQGNWQTMIGVLQEHDATIPIPVA